MTPLLGGNSLTHLEVYHQHADPLGNHGGCAHIHAICHEVYYVLSGRGRGEFHDPERGYSSEPLKPGTLLQFEPGILHKLFSDGNLVILAMLGNAGLAEAGDARIWFGPEVDAEPEAYRLHAALPAHAKLENALARRDASSVAYAKLCETYTKDREAWRSQLLAFRNRHLENIAKQRNNLDPIIDVAHVAWGRDSQRRLRALPNMPDAKPVKKYQLPPETRLGMCGLLRCLP